MTAKQRSAELWLLQFILMQGIQILRIHDVNEVIQGIKVFNQIIRN